MIIRHDTIGNPFNRPDADRIAQWLRSTPLVSEFCTQNGWIDDDTMRYEVCGQDDRGVWINIYFTEVVMEGSGCVADRVDCFGQLALRLDDRGEIIEGRVL